MSVAPNFPTVGNSSALFNAVAYKHTVLKISDVFGTPVKFFIWNLMLDNGSPCVRVKMEIAAQ
eukprot:5520662-Karenia_brevis.AAC.1